MPLLLMLSPLQGAEWTVGVYMCADNGMSDQSYRDIEEMCTVGSTGEVNIVVQVDRPARDSAPGCRRLLVQAGETRLLADLGPVDMADPATLGGFGRFLKRNYPARNCLLVLWDHGTGWGEGYRQEGKPQTPNPKSQDGGRGQNAECRMQNAGWSLTLGPRSPVPDPRSPSDAIFIDESHRHMMGVAGGELAAALAAFESGWGARPEVLGFDACLMGMVEVAGECIGRAGLAVAAEGLVPFGGWPYTEVLGCLTARPTTTPEAFAAALCSAYVAAYPQDTVEMAAVDLDALDRLMPMLAAAVESRGADSAMRSARARAQTFSAGGARPPCAADEQVDLVHLWELAGGQGPLVEALSGAVVARVSSGAWLSNARGLACWFPSRYLSLKSLHESYARLSFADRVGWTAMLNRFFGSDDVEPTRPDITRHRFARGGLRLWWQRARDLAPVRYTLYGASAVAEVQSDPCEDLGRWMARGWTASAARFRSGARSLFSGIGANLDNSIESAEPVALPEGGLLSLYAWHDLRESEDSAGIERDIVRVEWADRRGDWRALDSLYGSATEWRERRWVLPAADSAYLRLRFTTHGAVSGAGCYIDDIKVYALAGTTPVASGLEDTTFELTGLERNPAGYSWFVTAADSFGNLSDAGQFYAVPVEDWAEPYTLPAPFAGACKLVLDFPAGAACRVSIFTLSGMLVRRFEGVTGRELAWDGRNQYGRDIAAGVYLVVVEADGFRRVGRIAKAGE